MKQTLSFLLISSLIVGLSACGGGGGSKKSETPPPVTSSASSVISSSSSSAISSITTSSSFSSSSNLSTSSASSSSGTVGQKTAQISGVVSLEFSDANDSDTAAPVTVKLSLLNSKGDVIDESSPRLIESGGIFDEAELPFSAELTGEDAKTIVVLVSKDGFSDYARRFEFASKVSLSATLNRLQELTIEPTQVTSISGKTLEGFNVSVNNSNGNENIVQGDSGAIADLSVSIPQSALPTGTTSVDVSMQAFNPNDPEEAKSFPGAYEDSTGNKLLSVAFNYTDVKTNAGVSLQKIAQDTRNLRLAAQKQSGKAISPMQFAKQNSQKTGVDLEPVIINRKIPFESCVSLSQLGDANPTLEGFQVPVYTYNTTNGLWDLLGYGTLFNEAGNKIPANQNTFNCSVNTYVLEIEATNEIFLSNWWNLDYPLIFTQPVKLCANLQLKNEGDKPLAGTVLFVADDDNTRSFSSETFVSDDKGFVHIEVISLDQGTDLDAVARIYNMFDFAGYTEVPIKLSTTCDINAKPVIVPIAVPEMCEVDGRVVSAAGLPLAQQFIIATHVAGQQPLIPGFASTDSDGRYHLSLACKQKYQLKNAFSYIFSDTNAATQIEANVNGSIDLSEVSDSGSVAVVNDMVFNSSIPFATVYPSEDSLAQMSMFVMYASTNFPLTYSFEVKGENEQILATYSGTVTEADFNVDDGFGYAEIRINHNLTDDQIEANKLYTAVGEIKDSQGNTGEIRGLYIRESEAD